jgi:predicted metal-dependent hydrolase
MQLALPFAPFDEFDVAPPAPVAAIYAIEFLEPTEPLEPPEPTQSLEPMYFVRHPRARRYVLRVEGDGRLRVTIPRGGSRREAETFVERNVGWIVRQRARLPVARRPVDDHQALRAQACRELPRRLLDLAARYGLRVARVSIRNQRSRWGSCGRDGHICLNWRLILMPASVRDYVLVHELMHLRRMDHSPAYWRLVGEAFPEYRCARDWLRRHGPSLR